ncbi:MAG: FprA family A-type flavoprotein [Candidatus Omnitrophica bacterium]|jgi:flavorubredoxin|nr:FprA family A-type flavoprotein [Candidatus Omnitrophota bacterium]
MVKIAENIYWTGYVDWSLRNFHGYSTPSGSTYNAYLIFDEQPTLIKTVKHYGFEEMLSRIKEVIEPSKIKYIISNHTEMDHSGSIGKMLKLCPGAQIVCSPKGQEGLKRHFKENWNFKIVNSGDTLNIGRRNLKFFLMPMVHWPDSMATYSIEDNILFPNDAFGQHYASSERFADCIGIDVVVKEATKYYANIVMPYGGQVIKALEALKDIKLDTICPSHGLIWRRKEDIEKIVSLYKKLANYESDRSVVVIYDTMWHSTQMMAQKLYELIDREGISVKLYNLQDTNISDIIAEIISAKVVMVGSPILNNKILPNMGAFLTYLKGLKPKNRYAFTFGSYGWAKIGFKELEDSLKEAGMELLAEGRYANYIPDDTELDNLKDIVIKIKNLLAS